VNERRLIGIVAAMSVATVAIGLRAGAGETVRAAIVMGAPLPRGGGRVALQLRTQEDDGHTRTAISSPFSATIRARGTERKFSGKTNVDGVAELAFDAPELAAGDPIDFDVKDDRGGVLARGAGAWPRPMPSQTVLDHQSLRAARDEGALRMRVSLLDGALAPGETGRAWVSVTSIGEPPRDVHVDATPDLGLEIVNPFAPSGASAGTIDLVARGMSGAVALHAKDALGREGDWYGAIPVASGALHVDAPHDAPVGPLHVVVTSASAGTLAYVELDDDAGRSAASALELTGDPARGEATFDLRTPGRHFLVVSSSPDGAANVTGATRALPLWVGAPVSDDVLAELAGRAFPRFVMLDGFTGERARLAKRKRKGRLIALGALALGSFLETLLLLRAASEGRRRMRRLQHAMIEEDAEPRVAPRTPFDLVVVLGLSLLGFALLFALVAVFASK
jgi:hypothetical protein